MKKAEDKTGLDPQVLEALKRMQMGAAPYTGPTSKPGWTSPVFTGASQPVSGPACLPGSEHGKECLPSSGTVKNGGPRSGQSKSPSQQGSSASTPPSSNIASPPPDGRDGAAPQYAKVDKYKSTVHLNVRDNADVAVIFSKIEENRLSAPNDHIVSLSFTGKKMDYRLEPDSGELFVTFTPDRDEKVVNFWVLTEKGMSYRVMASLEDVPGVQVFFDNNDLVEARGSESADGETGYTGRVVSLVKGLETGKPLQGFQVSRPVKSVQLLPSLDGLVLVEYAGRDLTGDKIALKNTSDTPMFVVESDLTGRLNNLAAVWFDVAERQGGRVLLAPGQIIPAVVVFARRAGDE
ncbi:TraK domain-containing protein [Nitrospirillum amazonense]|uniref:TraK domain-containing protein n=1 Tax=Nitrospirillum amazonense TaxID=28077 RepID=UPI002412C0C7|nr:type-F conjugative transfer system secretin TraK [Nitrospirillum amazonense]MDG3444533.1 type-F conjugative transfer system secretin TraK [Nitrospirillum amazonense]